MSANPSPTPHDDPVLRETLKRCSPDTYYAACKFRASGDLPALHAVVLGVVERFVERDLRAKLQGAPQPVSALRLREDLALDSLTMMEIVMTAEEVLRITISNEELTRLRTVGAVQGFIAEKVATSRILAPHSAHPAIENWDLGAVSEQLRQIETRAVAPLRPLSDRRPHHA